MPDNKFSSSVDDILENLKKEQPELWKSSQAVNDILADFGWSNSTQQEQATNQSQKDAGVIEGQQPPVQTFWSQEEVQRQNTKTKKQAQAAQEEATNSPQAERHIKRKKTFKREQLETQKSAQPTAEKNKQDKEQTDAIKPPRLSDTIQMDKEFQKFFSESIAVIPDLKEEQEQHPGFFARFVRGKKENTNEPESVDEDEGLYAQDEYVQTAPTREIPLIIEPDFSQPSAQNIEKSTASPKNNSKTGTVCIPFEEAVTRQMDLLKETESEQESTEEAQTEQEEKKSWLPFSIPKFWGSEENNGSVFEDAAAQDYMEDYETLGDAPAVQQDLQHLQFLTAVRTVVACVIGVMLLYLGLAVGESPLPPISAVDPDVAPASFLSVNLLLLLAACGINWRVFANGIRGVRGTPTPDTIPAFVCIGAALQLVVLLMGANSFDAEKTTVFAAPAVWLLCFSALGKYLMSGVFCKNFEMLTSGTDHSAAFAVEDEELTQKLAQGLGEPEPRLLASRPTTLIRGFLRRSFSVRKSDHMLQKMSWVLGVTAVLAALITLAGQRGFGMAFTVLAGTLCLGGPLSVTLLSAVPSMLMQKSASRVGAIIPGWNSIEELGSTNMIVVGAKDLFPAKSVRLHGIKTFEKERIDLAILYAASVLIEGCDTLRDVFMNIIQGKTDILFEVENLENDPGYGFTAWVQHNRIIIGNRAMMEKQGVEIPSLDYENRYTKGVKKPIYLAVSGRLFGMFLVSYKADQQAAEVLSELRHHGISVLVKSDDFSLNTQMVTEMYGLPEGCLKVLATSERRDLEPLVEYSQYTEGCMGHIGTFASFVGGFLAASDAASAEKLSTLVQTAGVVLSAILSILLAFTGGIAEIALPALILYQAAWTVLTLVIPVIKRY